MEPNGNQIHDISGAAPSALAEMIGQQSVINQVAVALRAANADQKKMDSALLVGPPGLGKSALAQVIAKEMKVGFHEVLGQSVTDIVDLNALLLGAKEKDIVHIDECHELEKEYQTALYLAIDQRKIFLQGNKSGKTPEAIAIADFTVLLSTTDEYCLLQPLRDRMRLTLRFSFYDKEELGTIIRHRSQSLGWEVEESVFPLVAQRARGTPRLALRLLQACRRVCRAEGEKVMTPAHLKRACELEGIDSLGLGPTEQRYLRILEERANRLNVLASILGLPPRTIAQVSEPFLIRAGLIIKDDQSRRQLTAKGRRHLSNGCPKRGKLAST